MKLFLTWDISRYFWTQKLSGLLYRDHFEGNSMRNWNSKDVLPHLISCLRYSVICEITNKTSCSSWTNQSKQTQRRIWWRSSLPCFILVKKPSLLSHFFTGKERFYFLFSYILFPYVLNLQISYGLVISLPGRQCFSTIDKKQQWTLVTGNNF